jgi:3-methyladenine DNA glycosylase/8-oxoguanine DNA glycosylase
MPSCTLTLPLPRPFEFRLCLFGHGWVALAPHAFDEDAATFTTVLRLPTRAVDATLTEAENGAGALRLVLTAATKPTAAERALAVRHLRHMLRLDDDLTAFHARCATEPRLRWIARRGGGRLLRSATVFEDLLKLLFTTNTTWAGTEAMTRNLVAAAGTAAPSGRRAFPTPAECPREPAFWRDVVRTGYRAQACVQLVAAFVDGSHGDDDFLRPQPAAELWRRLTGLRGFGPYAAGQAMRLLGHYEHLALDSWCRAQFAQRARRKQPPADATIARRYAPFAPFQGLAMWVDLTADWHGE